jgi:ABC-type branched-subunit amino acid transport system ATPase component
MLKLTHVSKSFGGLKVLDELSLTVDAARYFWSDRPQWRGQNYRVSI